MHTCFSLCDNNNIQNDQSLGDNISKIQYCEKAKQAMIQAWVLTGDYTQKHSTEPINKVDNFLARFNPCSTLPLVEVYINEKKLIAICDCGASKTLLSSQLATLLWGEQILQTLVKQPHLTLKDINNKRLEILGKKSISFSLGTMEFQHEFIIYQSVQIELLLGNDFFKKFSLGIFPNIGIIPEHNNIFKLGNIEDSIFDLFLKDEICIQPGGQQVVTVYLNLDKEDPQRLSLINTFLVAHSENLQPEEDLQTLSIYFQYILFNANLESEVLLANNSDSIQYYRARQLIGHVEPIKQICTAQDIIKDDLSAQLYQNLQVLDGVTLDIPESRICIDTPSESSLNLDLINCHSTDQNDLSWLKQQHLKYSKMFSKDEWQVGSQKGSSIHFAVKTNATIAHQRFHKINPRIKEQADHIISMLLARNLIQFSKSPWSSRVLFIAKAPADAQVKGTSQVPGQKVIGGNTRKLRMVVDFRYVNSRLKQLNTQWPAPTIHEMLNELHGARYVSTMDVSQGFWHYKISEESKKLTAFCYGDIMYEFNRLPQGLCISSKVMQNKMKVFVLKHNLKGCCVYIDNIIIFGPDKETYKERLAAFFNACVSEGYKIKLNKSHHFIHQKFILFGFQVDLSNHSISPEPDKINKINNLIVPTTKKQLKTFIGAVSYFSSLIPTLQNDLSPLHAISGPNTRFIWSDICNQAFLKVKRDLIKIPIIYLLNPSQTIEVATDAAAGQYIAYSLWQHNSALDMLCPIKFNSHKLSPSERNLSQWEAEGLALVFCLAKEEPLLSFSNMIFSTDARSLTFINKYANSSSKISRWDLLIRSFQMTIRFLKNTEGIIKVTDLFTRNEIRGGQPNKKLKGMTLNDFMQFDFSDIPDLPISDAMNLIQQLQKLMNKVKCSPDTLLRIKTNFICPPAVITRTGGNDILAADRGFCVAQVISSDDPLQLDELPLSTSDIATTKNFSIPTINWDQEQCEPIKIKDILNNFLSGMSIDNLIQLQNEEKWIGNLLINPSPPGSVFKYEGIMMRKKQLLNGSYVSQIIIPEKISKALLKAYHERPCIKHDSVKKMKHNIQTLFYIKNYDKLCQEIIKSCVFCQLNKPYPQPRLAPGVKIMIDKPRQWVHLDICTVFSDFELDSFLTILDGFSKYCLYVPVNRDCTAQDIVDILFSHWIRHMGFPVALATDGASNMVNKLIGEICTLMNSRMIRIAPANSQSNPCERYNLIGLNALKIFSQNYKITELNFDMVLSLCSNMVNQAILPNGFSAHFLHFGKEPRVNTFLTMRNLTTAQNMENHVKDLMRAQNVMFVLARQMQDKIDKQDQTKQWPMKYRVGDFVLLRKNKLQGPRHGIKLQPIFYDEPFRIIKRFATNVMLTPYNRKYLKNRIKGEGIIHKNMCFIARISWLKPLKNPLRLLHLSINEKILQDFDKALQIPLVNTDVVKMMPKLTHSPVSIVAAFNPTIHMQPPTKVSSPCSDARAPLKVVIPNNATSIQDIFRVKLTTLKPGHTLSPLVSPTSLSDKSCSIQSEIIDKIIPKQKLMLDSILSVSSSYQSQIENSSLSASFLSVNSLQNYSEQNSIEICTDVEERTNAPSTPPQIDPSIQTIRAQLSAKKKSKSSIITTVTLPSGKSLIISKCPQPESTITNIKK